MQNKYVKKSAGDIEPFSKKKLRRFLRRIQVPVEQIEQIVDSVHANSGEEIFSRQIAEMVTEQIYQIPEGEVFAARYNLKRDLRKLGPAGHNFEKFIGRLFEIEGFEVKVGENVQGECVEHEIDVYATKQGELEIVEAKFHNREGTRSDVTIALYVYARFLDIAAAVSHTGLSPVMWIATNTKLTKTAYRYAACKGIQLLSVEQPHGNSIMDRVIKYGCFPVSTLPELEPFLDKLLQSDIVILKDVISTSNNKIAQLGIPVDTFNQAQLKAAKILSATPPQ